MQPLKRNIFKRICSNRVISNPHIHKFTQLQPFRCAHSSLSHQSDNSDVATNNVLNNEQKEFLTENGYLWIKNFVPTTVANNVQKRINYLLNSFDLSSSQTEKSIFAAHRAAKQYRDLYFLESGDKMRYFWEEDAFDSNGDLKQKPELSINKIGHALHTLDEYIHSYVYGYLPQLTYDIGLIKPIPIQSMYIFKQPGIGGEVSEHQDSSFLLTEPKTSCYGLWLCIDDTTIENGCIYVAPKTHNDPDIGLRNRFKRTDNDYNVTELIKLSHDGYLPKDNAIPVESKCGDLIILHGELIHWSNANKSDKSRHALMVHCVDGEYNWAKDNWLQYEDNKPLPKFTQKDCDNQDTVRQKIINY